MSNEVNKFKQPAIYDLVQKNVNENNREDKINSIVWLDLNFSTGGGLRYGVFGKDGVRHLDLAKYISKPEVVVYPSWQIRPYVTNSTSDSIYPLGYGSDVSSYVKSKITGEYGYNKIELTQENFKNNMSAGLPRDEYLPKKEVLTTVNLYHNNEKIGSYSMKTDYNYNGATVGLYAMPDLGSIRADGKTCKTTPHRGVLCNVDDNHLVNKVDVVFS
jgi:hypothetical protein